jgi:hypothetical protein
MTVLTVMNIDMPPNTYQVLSEIRKILELEDVRNLFTYLVELPPLVEGLSAEWGLVIVVVLPTIAVMTVFSLTACSCYKKYKFFREALLWIKKRIFFSVFLRLVYMTYINVLVIANVGSVF